MVHKISRICGSGTRRPIIRRTTLWQSLICALSALILMGAAVPSTAQNESILYYFDPVNPMGSAANPAAGLVRDSAGNLYGTGSGGKYRAGVVFKVDANGVYSTLYTFTGGSTGSKDGCVPRAALTLDNAGNLYGTTSHCGSAAQAGNVFKIDSAGNETILHTFTSGADGAVPLGSLLRDQAGNLYGTTSEGGTSACHFYGSNGCGTIFRISSTGTFSLLHIFTGPEGTAPQAGLIEDGAGNFYGTAAGGGAGNGTVYKMDKAGHVTLLYSFESGVNPDGYQPASTLVRDLAGNLYGTTQSGGNFNDCNGSGCGIVFKLDAAGNETVLHMFNEYPDGAIPSSLVMDGKGNLYGEAGGADYYYDTVFKVDALGNFTVLHGFGGNGDGIDPCCSLVTDRQGNLYGTTEWGGQGNNGVIFKISVPQ